MARGLGGGHRVIHGVAGSGKTIILIHRAILLAQYLKKPVLVLCFSIPLASYLREIINQLCDGEHIVVNNFHEWCRHLLAESGLDIPSNSGKQVANVIDAVKDGKIPKAQYGGICVDEGHDFEPDWLTLLSQMVDSENNLLLLYDGAQSIYERKKFSLKSVGISARERTQILDLNYRNTREILDCSYHFAKTIMSSESPVDDHPPLIKPESAQRHGPLPTIRKFSDITEEAIFIAQSIRDYLNDGAELGEFGILCRNNGILKYINKTLESHNIAHIVYNDDDVKRNYSQATNTVALFTIHASKGLEFPTVIIPCFGETTHESPNTNEEIRILYVGMTRAMEKLLITYHEDNEFTQML